MAGKGRRGGGGGRSCRWAAGRGGEEQRAGGGGRSGARAPPSAAAHKAHVVEVLPVGAAQRELGEGDGRRAAEGATHGAAEVPVAQARDAVPEGAQSVRAHKRPDQPSGAGNETLAPGDSSKPPPPTTTAVFPDKVVGQTV